MKDSIGKLSSVFRSRFLEQIHGFRTTYSYQYLYHKIYQQLNQKVFYQRLILRGSRNRHQTDRLLVEERYSNVMKKAK